MKGKRIAILGLGRSGLAVARAALSLGAFPIVYDRSSRDRILKRDVLEEAEAIGVPLVFDWSGDFSGTDIPVRVSEGSSGDSVVFPEDTDWNVRATMADLLITNPAVDSRSPVLRQAVQAGVEVISEIEFAYRIAEAPIIAITGTNGKTTTTVMTYLILLACGEKPILCGNIFGSGYPEVTLTEAALVASADQVLVAEVSSFQLEWVRDFRPVSAGITNIVPDHQDRYASFEDYAAAKMRIHAAQGNGDFAVVGMPGTPTPVRRLTALPLRSAQGEGSGTPSPASRGRGGEGVPADSDPEAARRGPVIFSFGEDAEVTQDSLRILDKSIPLDSLPFTEAHNFTNAAMAALLAYGYLNWRAERDPGSNAAGLLGLSETRWTGRTDRTNRQYESDKSDRSDTVRPQLPQQIIDGLRQFRGVAHRMERLGAKNGIEVINNSMCTNPEAVLASARSIKSGGEHVLIGGVNKGLDFTPLKPFFAGNHNKAYIFGRDRDEIWRMLGEIHPRFETMGEAFAAAVQEARSGETIMLSPGCASTDQFEDFRDRGDVFRKIAKEWLDDTST